MKRTVLIIIIMFISYNAVAQNNTNNNTAARSFEKGVELFDQGNFGDAYDQFVKAYTTAPNWRVLYNIGQSLRRLNRYSEAIDIFEQYLQEGGDSIDSEKRTVVQQLIDQMRQELNSDANQNQQQNNQQTPNTQNTNIVRNEPVRFEADVNNEQNVNTADLTPLTPFYKTWWFWTVVGVVVAGAGVGTALAITEPFEEDVSADYRFEEDF